MAPVIESTARAPITMLPEPFTVVDSFVAEVTVKFADWLSTGHGSW
jgi:hypothetical protein